MTCPSCVSLRHLWEFCRNRRFSTPALSIKQKPKASSTPAQFRWPIDHRMLGPQQWVWLLTRVGYAVVERGLPMKSREVCRKGVAGEPGFAPPPSQAPETLSVNYPGGVTASVRAGSKKKTVTALFHGGSEPNDELKDAPFVMQFAKDEDTRKAVEFLHNSHRTGSVEVHSPRRTIPRPQSASDINSR
jgi:hypothetical protein